MNQDLRQIVRDVPAGVEHHLDPGAIVRKMRSRRRRRWSVGAASLGVASVVALSLASTSFWRDDDADPGPATGQASSVDKRPYSDWIPEAEVLGTPAPIGSLIYSECSPECTAMVHTSGNAPFPLEALSADAAKLVAQQLESSTLSYDGRWLGAPAGDGDFKLFDLSSGESVTVPNTPTGQGWQALGWSARSSGLTLVQHDAAGNASLFLHVTFIPSVKIGDVVPSPRLDMVPASATGSEIVELATRAADGVGRTQPTTDADRGLVLTPKDFEVGQTIELLTDRDFSTCMSAIETLDGSDGVPMSWTPPYLDPALASVPSTTQLVFRTDDEDPIAVISKSCEETPAFGSGRYELPREGALLGALPDGGVAMRVEGENEDEIHAVGLREGEDVLAEVPSGSAVLLPGGSSYR